MIKKMKVLLKVIKSVCIALLSVLLIFNLIGIAQRALFKQELPMLFGFGTAVVITGSMEPAVNVDDMILVHKQSDYQKDDIVVYKANSYITHRIVEETNDGYITKGDANNTTDGEILKNQVVGKVIMTIPKVGIVINFLKSPLGMLIVIMGLFALIELPNLIRSRKSKETYKRSNKNILNGGRTL